MVWSSFLEGLPALEPAIVWSLRQILVSSLEVLSFIDSVNITSTEARVRGKEADNIKPPARL
jgi:hypothetical protein